MTAITFSKHLPIRDDSFPLSHQHFHLKFHLMVRFFKFVWKVKTIFSLIESRECLNIASHQCNCILPTRNSIPKQMIYSS
jgi:hypothetical protein